MKDTDFSFRIFITAVVSLLLTCALLIKVGTVNSYLSVLLVIALYFTIFFLMNKWSKTNVDLERLIIYFVLASSFFQAAFVSVNLGPFSLFPYRIFFILLFSLFMLKVITNSRDELNSTRYVQGYLSFLFFWLGYSLISLSWAKSFTDGIKYLVIMGIGVFLVYFVAAFLKKQSDYTILFYLWLAMMVILVLIGVWNHVTHNHLSSSSIIDLPLHKQHIPTSVFYNQNDFASYLVISVFFVLAFVKHIKNQLFKIFGLGIILISVYLIYVTSSRASLLALGIGLMGLFFIYASPRIRIMVTGIAVLLISVLFALNLDKVAAFTSHTSETDNSVNIRTNLIKNALYFTSETFGFGVGTGNAEYYMENESVFSTQNVYNVHNWYLEILLNSGIVIFIGYMVFYLSLIVSLYRIYKATDSGSTKMICEALLGALIAFSVASISPSSISNLNYFWVLYAFVIGFINVIRLNAKKE